MTFLAFLYEFLIYYLHICLAYQSTRNSNQEKSEVCIVIASKELFHEFVRKKNFNFSQSVCHFIQNF